MEDHRLDRIGEDGPMTLKHMKALERIAELEAEVERLRGAGKLAREILQYHSSTYARDACIALDAALAPAEAGEGDGWHIGNPDQHKAKP